MTRCARSVLLTASSLLLLAAGCPADDADTKKPDVDADAGSENADPDVETLSLDEGSFSVADGEEVSYCVKIPMPKKFAGRELALVGWESDVPTPTHHYFMTYTPDATAGDAPVPCKGESGVLPQTESGEAFSTSGVLNTKILFAVGVGKSKQLTHAGYGAIIEADGTFVTNHHVLNLTGKTADLHARFKLSVKDASLVPHPVRSLVCSQNTLTLPKGKASTATATCIAPFDMDIVMMAGHAHARLTRFEARKFDGKVAAADMLYESFQWDSPDVKTFEQPLHLKKGEGISFQCDYMNTSDKDIKFGLNANDEMCVVFAGYALPEGNEYVVPPPLFGSVFKEGGQIKATDSTKTPFFF